MECWCKKKIQHKLCWRVIECMVYHNHHKVHYVQMVSHSWLFKMLCMAQNWHAKTTRAQTMARSAIAVIVVMRKHTTRSCTQFPKFHYVRHTYAPNIKAQEGQLAQTTRCSSSDCSNGLELRVSSRHLADCRSHLDRYCRQVAESDSRTTPASRSTK